MRDTEENLSLSFVCIQIRGLGPVWSVPLSLSLTHTHTHTHTHTPTHTAWVKGIEEIPEK